MLDSNNNLAIVRKYLEKNIERTIMTLNDNYEMLSIISKNDKRESKVEETIEQATYEALIRLDSYFKQYKDFFGKLNDKYLKPESLLNESINKFRESYLANSEAIRSLVNLKIKRGRSRINEDKLNQSNQSNNDVVEGKD